MNFLIIFFLISLVNTIHVGHIAEYHYQLDESHLRLKFVIEKEELLSFDFDNCDLLNMTALCVANYISEHSTISINCKNVEMELQSSYTQDDHFIILLKSEFEISDITEIVIQNDCFYEFNDDFKNRIILDMDQFQKSFLLNQKRNRMQLP